MPEDILVRSYVPSDLAAIQRIHEANGIDYRLPNLDRFPVHKVMEVDGVVRASYGLQHAVEAHLWMSRDNWADPEGKWLTIKALDKEAVDAAAALGIDSVICCVPPGYERFGRRIKALGFTKVRPDWGIFTKHSGDQR